jgi:hypothetical protein
LKALFLIDVTTLMSLFNLRRLRDEILMEIAELKDTRLIVEALLM